MKIKKTILLFLTFLNVILFISCKKYLDEKSDKSLVIPQSLEDFQGLLDDLIVMNQNTPSRGETASDDYFITKSTFDTRPLFQQEAYTWTPGEYYIGNDWNLNYIPVYNANLCLEGLEKISRTQSNELLWNNVKGSAHFFRAYSFLNLLWIYAKAYDSLTYNSDKGIVLRLNSDFNIPSLRSSVKKCYDQVLSDATNAALFLPDHAQNLMRPSKAAAYGLLARAYLSMRIYDSAGKYANKALELKDYLMDYNNNDLVKSTSSIPFKPYNNEIIFYSQTNTNVFLYSTARAIIDTTLYSLYNQKDMRRVVFFTSTGIYQKFKGSYAATNQFFSGIATDELYLIRAECNARSGHTDLALQDLNKLLINRWKTDSFSPVVTSSSDEAVEIILTERRKELMMRGLRWMDIKRLNKEGAEILLQRRVGDIIYTLQPNDDRYALPLPTDIISITGIEQN